MMNTTVLMCTWYFAVDKLDLSNFDSFVKQGSVCIVNAASERDVAVFAAGMIQVNFLPCTVVYLKFLLKEYSKQAFNFLIFFIGRQSRRENGSYAELRLASYLLVLELFQRLPFHLSILE